MVLPEVRAELRQALLAFQQGKTTNVDFDLDTYERLCVRSRDGAVNAVGEYWSGHCGASDLQTFRLTGRRALSADGWAAAQCCDRFLASDHEYEWPEFPQAFVLATLSMIGLAAGLVVSLFCLIFLVAALLASPRDYVKTMLMVIMVAAWAPGWILARWSMRSKQDALERFWAHGSQKHWPFLCEADFHKSQEA